MYNLELAYKDIDMEALHAEMKAELGDDFHGISTHEGGVIVHLERKEARAVDVAGRLYYSHDVSKHPQKPKPKSTEERLAAMEAEILALKTANAKLEAQAVTPKAK